MVGIQTGCIGIKHLMVSYNQHSHFIYVGDLSKIIKSRERNKTSMAYNANHSVNQTLGSVKKSFLTDPEYNVENEVDYMLYKKTGMRKSKKSSVSLG